MGSLTRGNGNIAELRVWKGKVSYEFKAVRMREKTKERGRPAPDLESRAAPNTFPLGQRHLRLRRNEWVGGGTPPLLGYLAAAAGSGNFRPAPGLPGGLSKP